MRIINHWHHWQPLNYFFELTLLDITVLGFGWDHVPLYSTLHVTLFNFCFDIILWERD